MEQDERPPAARAPVREAAGLADLDVVWHDPDRTG